MTSSSYLDPRNWPGSPEQAQASGNPLDLINSLLQNPPDFSQQAAEQLAGVYNPQYQAINGQIDLTKKNAKYSDAQLAAMYKALGKDIKGQRGQIESNYAHGKADVGKAFAQGGATIKNAFADANNQLGDIFSKLGIEAAAADPRTLATNARDSKLLQGLLAVDASGSQNALTGHRTGSMGFNTDAQAIAAQEGASQRSQLQRALQDKLASIGNQRLQLDSQRAGAQLDLTNSLQNQWMSGQQKMADQAMSSWQDAQAAMAKAAQGATNGPSAYQQYQMMGPIDKAYSRAAELFGTGDNRASQAVAMLTQLGNDQQFHNGFEFVNQALEANRRAATQGGQPLPEDQLRALAAYLYDQMNPQALPSYVQN